MVEAARGVGAEVGDEAHGGQETGGSLFEGSTAAVGLIGSEIEVRSHVGDTFEEGVADRNLVINSVTPFADVGALGALAFFDRRAGIMTLMLPVALLPKPPPVYSAMSTMSLDSMCIHRAIASSVWTVLWVPECRYSLPFCQYAIADRDSSV